MYDFKFLSKFYANNFLIKKHAPGDWDGDENSFGRPNEFSVGQKHLLFIEACSLFSVHVADFSLFLHNLLNSPPVIFEHGPASQESRKRLYRER